MMRRASCQANGLPMQALIPLPNGFQAFFGSLLKCSSSMRSGLYSVASGPQIAGSICDLARKSKQLVPFSTGYFPPRTVSSRGTTPIVLIGELTLRVSRSI